LIIFAAPMPDIMKKFLFPFFLFILITSSLSAQEVILKKGRYVLRETGKPYTGIYRENDPENKLVSEISIKNGLLDGNTIVYFPSGAKKEERAYREGKKHGTWTNWTESGVKIAEAGFIDGKKDGAWFVWDDEGVKRYDMFYENGQKKGTWIIYDAAGKEISREEFK